ncbi:MAG: GAF domain-containing protein [Proteobacteria bacterium]|nr:GAF domain-containing protein [Pseudomonadota bacterium]
MDQNEFFRNATLRICGTLKIEEGLRACIEFLSQHIPADSIYLERYERELGAWRVVARATVEKGEKMDVLIPLPESSREAVMHMARAFRDGGIPPVIVVNNPEEEPVTHKILEGLGELSSSAMGLALIVEDRVIGILGLLAEGFNRFNEQHARLFSTLNEPCFVAMSNTLEHEKVVKLKDRLADDNRFLHKELRRISGDQIVGADYGLGEVMKKVGLVAPTDSPILLSGETGVGKDVIANTIHLSSSRREGPFIPVNCGAIPESLLDSELFGHEKGAFTGALSRKRGRFERANQGTIFLDEIGEMPLSAQVRLLRVLQNREIERIGGNKAIKLDIRIIAATNKDLEQEVKEGRFREDLWFRINVFPIIIPPLRERIGDIPALVQHFIERKTRELKVGDTPRIADGAIDPLMTYHWPGNVRELENIVERALILHQGKPLRFDILGASSSQPVAASPSAPDPQSLDLDEMNVQHITRVLKMTDGKIHGPGGAGELLGVNPNTLRYKMKKLGISFRK